MTPEDRRVTFALDIAATMIAVVIAAWIFGVGPFGT